MSSKTTQKDKIRDKVYEILEKNKNGIRYADLVREIHKELPEIPVNTIHGSIWDFKQSIDKGEIEDVVRPDKGLYILRKYYESASEDKPEDKPNENNKKKPYEKDFYQSFADYLKNNLEECSEAITLGGNIFGDKWGTPDVLGINKFPDRKVFKPLIEIVSAEIKTDTNNLVTAFGQACAYKLFSHKVYLVIPKEAEKDVARIESLCLRFGIGLILFDRENPENPKFEIRTRAIKQEPDYFYVNEYLGNKEELLAKLGL